MRQSRTQSILAIFFLVVVLFPLTVKDMHYHTYSFEHSQAEQSGIGTAQKVENDCEICDYEFVQFLSHTTFFTFFQDFPSTTITICQHDKLEALRYLLQLLRAPPVI